MTHLDQSLLFRTGDPDFMTSLVRGLEVLKSFSGGDGELTAGEICKRTGLSRAVVRRCLYTLSEAGYVARTSDGFRLDAKVLSLSQPYYSARNSLPAIAQPFLESVSGQIHESCSLAVLSGEEVVYVARSATRRIMTVSLNVGSRLPAHYTSLGRVLISDLSSAEIDQFLARHAPLAHTPKSITTRRALKKAISDVRTQGYSVVDEELEIGLRSIAVPVRQANDKVIAAMNVGVQATRFTKKQLIGTVLPALSEAAHRLEEDLSGVYGLEPQMA